MSKPIGEYWRECRELSQSDFERIEPPIKTDSKPLIPLPSEKQGITGEVLNRKHTIRGKHQTVKPENPLVRDRNGKLITPKPREQTWLKVKRRIEHETRDGRIIDNPAFSEIVELDERPESIADNIKRESLTACKKLIGRILKGEFLTAEHLEYSPEYIELSAIAKRANVCLKCQKAVKAVNRRFKKYDFENPNGANTNDDIAKCRPLYIVVDVDGKAQFRLWLGFQNGECVLATRRMKTNRNGKRLNISDVYFDGRIMPVNEMIHTNALCNCA